ncbi:hypothetical protein EVA_02026 [gut metagenome]|uniref:Uncharacterized protein n=1 Tax=gut metagenome TaxID=749906 RepID=J9GQ06_9ZZZZ
MLHKLTYNNYNICWTIAIDIALHINTPNNWSTLCHATYPQKSKRTATIGAALT